MSKKSAEEREKRQAEEKKSKAITAERVYLQKQIQVLEDKAKVRDTKTIVLLSYGINHL